MGEYEDDKDVNDDWDSLLALGIFLQQLLHDDDDDDGYDDDDEGYDDDDEDGLAGQGQLDRPSTSKHDDDDDNDGYDDDDEDEDDGDDDDDAMI